MGASGKLSPAYVNNPLAATHDPTIDSIVITWGALAASISLF
jgi:hypothetical protein